MKKINNLSSLSKNILAHSSRIGIMFFNQILLVPIYIMYMGTDLYGDWIILVAISQFFNISDLGLNMVTNNEICKMGLSGDKNRIDSLITNNYLLIVLLMSIFILIIFAGGAFFNYNTIFGVRKIPSCKTLFIVLFLVVQVFLYMISKIPDAILNASYRAHIATYMNNIVLLSNSLVMAIGVILKFDLQIVSFCSIIPALSSWIIKCIITRNIYRYVPSYQSISSKTFKEIMGPSISYMSFPLSNAFLFQGYTLAIGHFYSSSLLILFNTTRTMVNFIRSLMEVVLQGSRPEFSIAYGKNDVNKKMKIQKNVIKACFLIYIVTFLFLFLFGYKIYAIWTHGQIEYNHKLMICFAIVIISSTIWNSQSVPLMSTNLHSTMGKLFLFFSIISLLFCVIINDYINNIYVSCLLICISDIPLWIYVTKKSKEIILKK